MCFQDLNEEVLQHVTIPNLRLNITSSSASSSSSSSSSFSGSFEQAPARFVAGDWNDDNLLDLLHQQPSSSSPSSSIGYDLILSSDTLYSLDSMPRLLHVLRRTLKRPTYADDGTAFLSRLSYS